MAEISMRGSLSEDTKGDEDRSLNISVAAISEPDGRKFPSLPNASSTNACCQMQHLLSTALTSPKHSKQSDTTLKPEGCQCCLTLPLVCQLPMP